MFFHHGADVHNVYDYVSKNESPNNYKMPLLFNQMSFGCQPNPHQIHRHGYFYQNPLHINESSPDQNNQKNNLSVNAGKFLTPSGSAFSHKLNGPINSRTSSVFKTPEGLSVSGRKLNLPQT